MQQATLLPGDYVLTEGMTEEQYHAVARAFMNAGANEGEYPNTQYAFEAGLECFGVSPKDVSLFHGSREGTVFKNGRQLTIDQVLNATNAGGKEADMHITDKLNQARDERDKAQARYEATLEEHRAAYPWLIIDEREELEEQPTEDMTDPANWRAGDWLKCVDDGAIDLTGGKRYQVLAMSAYNDPIIDDDGDSNIDRPALYFRFHSRP